MNRPDDDSDEKIEVLGQFLEELQQSPDAEAVVRRFALAHPCWTRDFVEEAVMSRVLETSRADAVLPDLSRLTDFRVDRAIAVGGMGVVYEAEQLSLNRRVALKVRYGHSTPEREAAFDREQRVLARLHQSHIVPIYQSGRCGVWQYFAMAYIEGATLHQLLRTVWTLVSHGKAVPELRELVAEAKRRDQRIDDTARLAEYAEDLAYRSTRGGNDDTNEADAAPRQPSHPVRLPPSYFRAVAALLADAAEAVAHAHAADVIHRDVKPSNIMVDLSGQCWLIDFGLADVAAPANGPTGKGGSPAGTPGYIAPEHLEQGGAPAGTTSDVWSLGVTLFEAVTLRRPFPDASPAAAMLPLRSLVPNVPVDLAAVCEKALRKDPAERYPSAKELAADLRRWLEDRPTVANPVRPWRAVGLWARRNRGWAAALGTAVLFLGTFAVLLVARAGHRAEQADLRSQAAEAEVSEEREKARLREREGWLHDAQQLQLGEAENGWSRRAWELLVRANEVRSDDRVRDLAVRTLRDLDADQVKFFPFGGSSVAFGPNEQSLLIGGFEDTAGVPVRSAAVWTAGSDQLTESTQAGEGPVAFDAKGEPHQLLCRDGELVLWDMAAKRATWRATIPAGSSKDLVPTLALSTDASLIAVSGEAERGRPFTQVWKSGSTEPWMEFDFATDAMTFSDARDLVALADPRNKRIAIRSLKSKELVAELPAGPLPIRSLAFGRNPRRGTGEHSRYLLAAGDAGGTIGVWDLRTRIPVSYCRGLPRDVFALAFHPDGTLLASGGREEVQVWEVSSGKPRLRIRPDSGIDYVTQIAFSSSGKRLAISSRGVFYQPCTTLWSLSDRRGLCRLSGLSGQVETIVVSPDGTTAAALGQNWELGVWDLDAGRLKFLLEVPPGEYADNAGLTFSPDGRSLAYSVSTARQGTALLVDAATGDERRRWTLPPGLQHHLAFDGPGVLRHFQVDVASGAGLPTSNHPWRDHHRVGRLRNLLAADPLKVTAEVRDFPRHIFQARMTADGKYTVLDGIAEERWVKVVDNATGTITAALRSTCQAHSSDLTVDATGTVATVSLDDTRTTQFGLPSGEVLRATGTYVFASNAASGYVCRRFHVNAAGCFLFSTESMTPLANLALGSPVNAAAFDPSGQRLIWGGRDGSVVVCHLPDIRSRLNLLGGR